jgi:hypothetical protein
MDQTEIARVIAAQRHVRRGELEIDPGCEVAAVPTGIWVAAWVFVDKDDINAEILENFPKELEL